MRNTDFDVMTTTKNGLLLPLPFLFANGGANNVERSQSLCGGKVFSIYSCVSVLLFYCHAVDS